MGLFGIFGSKRTDDLKAIQDMIGHANELAESDLSEITKAMVAAKAARKALDEEILPIQAKLGPVCRHYAASRARLFKGQDGQLPLIDRALLAQGNVNTMLWLGQKANGCIDSCKPTDRDALMPCLPDKCRNKLRSTDQLENVLGGTSGLWHKRDEKIQKSCGTSDYTLFINPPVGFEPEDAGQMEEGAQEQCMFPPHLMALFAASCFVNSDKLPPHGGSRLVDASFASLGGRFL